MILENILWGIFIVILAACGYVFYRIIDDERKRKEFQSKD